MYIDNTTATDVGPAWYNIRGERRTVEGGTMSNTTLRSIFIRTLLALALLAAVSLSFGCEAEEEPNSGKEAAPAEEPAEEQARPEGYDSWVIYINDDDSYTEGGITYSIALNLTATNPTQSIAGTYTGTATAKTDTTGQVQGQQLNASAVANSSQLEFTLVDGSGTGDALAPLTAEEAVYSGTGSITMAAAGSGTIGAAGGAFSNTSGQAVEVYVQGPAVTFSVVISGHTYTFEGTLSGQ